MFYFVFSVAKQRGTGRTAQPIYVKQFVPTAHPIQEERSNAGYITKVNHSGFDLSGSVKLFQKTFAVFRQTRLVVRERRQNGTVIFVDKDDNPLPFQLIQFVNIVRKETSRW